jgi:ubiquinone/menaquinone biosynthesis C-methylase UbiE
LDGATQFFDCMPTRPSTDDRERSGTDRPMTTSDIADAYASRADTIGKWEFLDRAVTGRYRRHFELADGRVLDVACGTGPNFHHLEDATEVVGIDVSPDMLAHARETLRSLDVDGDVYEMDAQDLAFPDDSFDTVVSSLSTCTFPEPIAALSEMARVCRPDGRILLLEHGRVDIAPIAWFQDWRADAHYETVGCRWNQEPLELVRAADLDVQAAQTHVFGLLTRVVAHPES